MSPRDWSPEARAAFGAKMKAAAASRKKKANGAAATAGPEPEPAAALNPIATDVVAPPPKPKPAAKPKPKLQPAATAPLRGSAADHTIFVEELLSSLAAIPLDTISYDECGRMLNALSAASTAVALARRQRQEQLEAGSHRATCKTCGRQIDISKSGGFQILTERDEFHMPQNSYYCSQNCLLARNMPSHARQTPKEKKENRA